MEKFWLLFIPTSSRTAADDDDDDVDWNLIKKEFYSDPRWNVSFRVLQNCASKIFFALRGFTTTFNRALLPHDWWH